MKYKIKIEVEVTKEEAEKSYNNYRSVYEQIIEDVNVLAVIKAANVIKDEI